MDNQNANRAADDSFIARESPFINYLFAIIFIVISIAAFITMSHAKDAAFNHYSYICLAGLVPGITFLANGYRRPVIFEVNQRGIFYRSHLVTNWPNFVNAYLAHAEVPGSLSEHFYLVLEYIDPATGLTYLKRLKMSSSQDKSEDQVIEAVRTFYSGHLR